MPRSAGRASLFVLGLLTVACHRRGAPDQAQNSAPGSPSTLATAPVAPAPPTSAASSLREGSSGSPGDAVYAQEAEDRATCNRVHAAVSASDQPAEVEVQSLHGCDAEALYYGIGRDAEPSQARKCAYVQLKGGDEPVYGGAAILMMVYANGKGVPRNLDLALNFACRVGGAPAELSGRLRHIERLRSGSKTESEFDLCDDVTSGFMGGHCAGHRERMAAGQRSVRRNKASADLPKAEFDGLERAAKLFFDAREDNEVDLSGTLRAAFQIEERARLEDGYVAALEQIRTASFPRNEGDAKTIELELNKVYARLMACSQMATTEKLLGGVSREGIRKTQRRWLQYRGAWVPLGMRVRPETRRDVWHAWITQERTKMLADLATGC